MDVFTFNLYHDGAFVPNPLKYVEGGFKVVNDIQFEDMHIGNLIQVVTRLVLNPPKGLYYCLPGTTLTRGIRPLKTDKDMEAFIKVGYENGFKVELYTELYDYDVMGMSNNDNLHMIDENIDEPDYVGEEYDEDPENIDFHGNFIGTRDNPIPPLSGKYILEENDPDDDLIDAEYKIKKGVRYPSYNHETARDEFQPILSMKFKNPLQLKNALANYGVKHGYQLWYYRSDYKSLLVYCGRDIELGRCAASDKVNGKKATEASDKVKGKKVAEDSPKKPVKWTRMRMLKHKGHHCLFRLWASWMSSERWISRHYARDIILNSGISYKFTREDIREKYMVDVSLGKCKRAKQCALYEHDVGLIEHYGKLWEYRQAVLDSNPEVGESSKRGGGSFSRGRGTASMSRGSTSMDRGTATKGKGSTSMGKGTANKRGGSVTMGRGSASKRGGSATMGKGFDRGSQSKRGGSTTMGRGSQSKRGGSAGSTSMGRGSQIMRGGSAGSTVMGRGSRSKRGWSVRKGCDDSNNTKLFKGPTLSVLEAVDEAIQEHNDGLPSISEGQFHSLNQANCNSEHPILQHAPTLLETTTEESHTLRAPRLRPQIKPRGKSKRISKKRKVNYPEDGTGKTPDKPFSL
ncbi:hypothetical protein Tco_0637346 [Tanacetum coccineum]